MMELLLNVNNESFVNCKLERENLDMTSLSSSSSSSPPSASTSSSPINPDPNARNGSFSHQLNIVNDIDENANSTSHNKQNTCGNMTDKSIDRNKSIENTTNSEVFCICKRSADEYNEEDLMIECEACKDWLHGR
jgi:hypothetical protein